MHVAEDPKQERTHHDDEIAANHQGEQPNRNEADIAKREEQGHQQGFVGQWIEDNTHSAGDMNFAGGIPIEPVSCSGKNHQIECFGKTVISEQGRQDRRKNKAKDCYQVRELPDHISERITDLTIYEREFRNRRPPLRSCREGP